MQLGSRAVVRGVICLVLSLVGSAVCGDLHADSRQPRMGIFTKPDARVDLSLEFVASDGERGSLKRFVVAERPFILVPIFYNCPRLCGLTVSGVVDLVNQLPLSLGSDYSVVFYSFNPDDTTKDAADKRAKTLARLSHAPVPPSAVRFLTASPTTIQAINEQIGFRIRYADKELEHSSAIFIVRPDGAVQKYFAGVAFNASRVAQALRP